ncbi:MAG: CvpA family protein [Actinomycetota bacterium]
MTVFDYVVIGIVVASLLLGLWRGVVGELIALAAWVLAFFAAMEFGGDLAQSLFSGIGDKGMRALAGFAAAFIGVLVIMALVRMAASGLIKAVGLGVSDRLLGIVFGVARGVLIAMVLVAVGGMTSAPQQEWWREATTSAPLETAVLAAKPWLPPDLAKRIRFK